MIRGIVYAMAAAIVSFAAVTWASSVITDPPSAAVPASGGEAAAQQRELAALAQEREKQDRIIAQQRERIRRLEANLHGARVDLARLGERPTQQDAPDTVAADTETAAQQQRIATLESELKAAQAALADQVTTANESNAARGEEHARLAAGNAELWQEVQRLETVVAEYRGQVTTSERRHRHEVSQLQAEIDMRDQNIAAISRRLTASDAGAPRAASATNPPTAPTTDAGKANADAAAMAKAAADADAAEKAVAEKAATEKAKAEKAAVEQAAADKGAAVKAAAHVAAREQAAAEQVAAIKAAADKAIVERAAASAAAAPAISGVFSPTLEDGIRAYHDAQYRTAFDIWLQLAEQGDGQAQFHLGALYFEGRGTGKDLAKAREWLQRAQKNGDPRAAGMLSRVNAAAKTAAGTANGAHARGDA
jgi:hypothetical protein